LLTGKCPKDKYFSTCQNTSDKVPINTFKIEGPPRLKKSLSCLREAEAKLKYTLSSDKYG